MKKEAVKMASKTIRMRSDLTSKKRCQLTACQHVNNIVLPLESTWAGLKERANRGAVASYRTGSTLGTNKVARRSRATLLILESY